MEILPADLGEHWRTLLLQRRALARVRRATGTPGTIDIAAPAEEERVRKRDLRLRQFWVSKTDVDEKTREKLIEAINPSATGVSLLNRLRNTAAVVFWPAFIIALAVSEKSSDAPIPTFVGALSFWFVQEGLTTLLLPRRALRNIGKEAVTRTEIEGMLVTKRGELDERYLNLVLDAMRLTIPSETAKAEIVAALRALGETVSGLPGGALPIVDDPHLLRQSAQEKRALSHLERDSFVRESLARQAEAEERRAVLGEQGTNAARRVQTLRAEAETQIDSLRSVLMALESSSASSTNREIAAHLSEAVQRVAREAQASAQARREIEEMDLVALYGGPIPAPQPQAIPTVPVTPTGTVQPQQPAPQQVVRPGKWWRQS
jgi:hypothetical protein